MFDPPASTTGVLGLDVCTSMPHVCNVEMLEMLWELGKHSAN